MSKTKKIVLGVLSTLVVAVVLFLGVVAAQPSQFTVSRTATMAAPPEAVFPKVNDFHNWRPWSPWAKMDPDAKNTFEGSEAGKGAKFHWVGNSQVGEGSMTIVDSRPNEQVKIKLEFVKPMTSTADTLFTFKPEGDGTKVTWTMSGENNFIGKMFCMFMDMDAMVGGSFEEGLAAIKAEVEQKSGAEATPSTAPTSSDEPAAKP